MKRMHFRPRFCTVILGTTWVNEMNFVMTHAPGAGSIARPVDQQPSTWIVYLTKYINDSNSCPNITIVTRLLIIVTHPYDYVPQLSEMSSFHRMDSQQRLGIHCVMTRQHTQDRKTGENKQKKPLQMKRVVF